MKSMIKNCSVCNMIFDSSSSYESDICSECVLDEAFHSYLRALRRKKSGLTIAERIFLFIHG
jgi:hypothetical protein